MLRNYIYITTYKSCDTSVKNILENVNHDKNYDEIIKNFNINKFMNDITPVMTTLHKANKAHMDIKPANIIYCSKDTKLCNINDTCFKIIDYSLFDIDKIKELTLLDYFTMYKKYIKIYKAASKNSDSDIDIDIDIDTKILLTKINTYSASPEYLLPELLDFWKLYFKALQYFKQEYEKDVFYTKINKNKDYNKDLDKINISYLYKKSDEFALALTLRKIQRRKTLLTDVVDESIDDYIFKLTSNELYFDKTDLFTSTS